MSRKERASLLSFSERLGDWLHFDALFKVEDYRIDPDGYGQDLAGFLLDPASRRGSWTADELAIVEFAAYLWKAHLGPVVAARKEGILAAVAAGRSALAALGGSAYLASLSERITAAPGDVLILDKKLELELDGGRLKKLRLTPSLFAFPLMVVMDAPGEALFELSHAIPFNQPEEGEQGIRLLADTAFALSDPTRLRMLMMLAGGAASQKELGERMGYAKSTISRHVEILLRARLVRRSLDAGGKSLLELEASTLESFSTGLRHWIIP